MSLAMDLTVLYDTYVDVKMASMDAIWLFSMLMYSLCPPLCGYPPTHLPPYRGASGIGCASGISYASKRI